MDLGTGLPISVGILSVGLAVYKMVPSKRKCAECPLHPEMSSRVKRAEDRLGAGDTSFKEMREDISATKSLSIAIAKHLKIPVEAIADELKELLR
jgi:hypothetical protein